MHPRLKQALNSWWFPTLIFGGLYLTGLHTPVIVFFQRGVLATGLFQPDTESVGAADRADAVTVNLAALRMTDSEGQPVDPNRLLGRVVFLNLWTSWCPPCLAEMPNIDALYADYSEDDRIAFVLLNVEADPTKGRALVQQKEYRFPVYYLQAALPAQLGTGTLPTTLVISRTGEVAVRQEGMARYDTDGFRALLNRLAAQSPD